MLLFVKKFVFLLLSFNNLTLLGMLEIFFKLTLFSELKLFKLLEFVLFVKLLEL